MVRCRLCEKRIVLDLARGGWVHNDTGSAYGEDGHCVQPDQPGLPIGAQHYRRKAGKETRGQVMRG